MVDLRCQHLHSKVKQSVNHRILFYWRSLLFTHNCQTRHATSLASRSNKAFLTELEQLQQLKSTGKKRIPLHITSKINQNQLISPCLLSIHSYLQKGDAENAWKIFDQHLDQHIPQSTAHNLLYSLQDLINTLPNKSKDLYYQRLEALAGVIKRNKDLQWDKNEFCLAIELYGKLGQVNRAESLFKNMSLYASCAHSVEIYNQLLYVYLSQFKHIDELTKKRYISKMTTLEQDMLKRGVEPNTRTFNVLLAAKLKVNDLDGTEKLYARMTQPPDRNTFHILINGYLSSSRTKKDKDMVHYWMERLLQSGIVPNKKTFYSIMDGMANQAQFLSRTNEKSDLQILAQSISQLYKDLIKMGHRPDIQIINSLLKCYIAANDTKAIQEIMSSFLLPEKKGGCGNCGSCGCGGSKTDDPPVKPKHQVKPDLFTFNMLIRHHLFNEQSDQAFQMYDTMINAKLDPDSVTYGNFIWYYAKQGNVKELLRYVDVMQKKSIPYNNFIYNTLLNCSLKFPEQASLLEPHLCTMLASGDATLDSVSQNTILARHGMDEQQDIESNFERFTDILERNLYTATSSLDTRAYNTILQSAGKFYKPVHSGVVMTLDKIMDSLDISSLKPDIYTFALSIRNACYVGNMEKAESIFKTMLDTGIKPNEYVFSHLIYGYSNVNRVEKAHELLEYMVSQYQLSPTAINYAPLIKGYADSAEYDKAYKLFRDMLDKNINADLVIYTILASVFLKSPVRGNEKRAIELLDGIEKANIPLDSAALTLLAEAYSMHASSLLGHELVGQKKSSSETLAEYTQKIEKIYKNLKENQWLDAKAITTLLTAYNRFHNPEATWKLWNELKLDSSVTLMPYHYNAVLSGLTASKAWYPVAKAIYQEIVEHPTIQPDTQTFDSMIWGAYNVSDYQTIRQLWHDYHNRQTSFLLVKSYFAVLTALLNHNEVEEARKVFQQYQQLPSPPNSTIVWVGLINKLATHHGL